MRRWIVSLTVAVAVGLIAQSLYVKATQTAITGGFWMPSMTDEAHSINTSVYQINATGEFMQWITRAPKACDLEGFEVYISAFANAPDDGLRFSYQDVSLTTGIADGTVDQFAKTAGGSPSATGWVNPGDFSANRTVARGDLFAMVVDIETFTAGDDLAVGGLTRTSDLNFPYGVSVVGTKQPTTIPIAINRCSDNSHFYTTPEQLPITTTTDLAINTGTTPDEFGTTIQFPVPVKIGAVGWFGFPNSGADFDIVVYDNADSVLTTQSVDADLTSTNSTRRWNIHHLDTELSLSAATLYRVIIKPTTATNMTVNYNTLNSLSVFDGIEGGQTWYGTERTNAGAWTNYNSGTFRKPRLSVLVTSFDDGAGSGSSFIPAVFR